VKRREFITLVGGAIAGPLAARQSDISAAAREMQKSRAFVDFFERTFNE
jgi:hypothetical protein